MSEKPILFSSPMVRAILDGRKTMTRRVVKPQPPAATVDMRLHCDDWLPGWDDDDCAGCYVAHGDIGDRLRCPYGRPGDRLWVREAIRKGHGMNEMPVYRADIPDELSDAFAWRPSIHMPRCASRITLEVVAVRVERLNDISADDAISEGIEPCYADCGTCQIMTFKDYLTGATDRAARQSFQSLWDSINAQRGYGWASNPWVWVVEFKRVEA